MARGSNRYDDDEDFVPSRGHRSSSHSTERRVISPRAIKTYRIFILISMIWNAVAVTLLTTGMWTPQEGDASDIWLRAATLFFTAIGIAFAWLMPNGDEN